MSRCSIDVKLKPVAASAALVLISAFSSTALSDEFPALSPAFPKFNQVQVEEYYPVFDFDGDGCYPATPFDKNNNLSANPGLEASSITGQCHDYGWWNTANTLHRQLCNQRLEGNMTVRRCAHFFELYFEKDQAVQGSWLFGHRHDVETVIVWTGRRTYADGGNSHFVSHVSVSAHGKFDTRHIKDTIHNRGHAYVVYHKDGGGTHAFRFANQGDRDHVEFIGNGGDFFAPTIISYYTAYKTWKDDWDRYWQNVQFRNRLRDSYFGSASFKMRNDQSTLEVANSAIPNWDSFWSGFSFTTADIEWTRNEELWSNYPTVRPSLPE